jgi:hypothetical protein
LRPQTFTDARLAAAVVDRFTFNAHLLQTGSDSYRLKTARAKPTTKGDKSDR